MKISAIYIKELFTCALAKQVYGTIVVPWSWGVFSDDVGGTLAFEQRQEHIFYDPPHNFIFILGGSNRSDNTGNTTATGFAEKDIYFPIGKTRLERRNSNAGVIISNYFQPAWGCELSLVCEVFEIGDGGDI